jgi:hypothetical protein
MENNMIREHYQQVKYPTEPTGEIGATGEYPSIYMYDLGLNKINTHQL